MANYVTEVRLLSVPLENDYKHTLYFSSKSDQETYFKSKTVHSDDSYSYQRKDGFIRYDKGFEDLLNCNYVMYKNDDKWFYAFITKMEYKQDDRTDIYIETDVLQTWLFDYSLKTSFVEREHTENDAVGRHTVPEQLETGEYICNGTPVLDTFLKNTCIIMGVTEDPDGNKTVGKNYSGVFSGLGYRYATTTANATSFIEQYDKGKVDAIQTIFIAPTALISIDTENAGFIKESMMATTWETDLGSAPSSIDGYTPRNKKLLTFPYSYLYLSNQQGATAIYQNEKFYTGERKFKTYGVVCPGCSIRTVPQNYDNIALNTDSGLNLGKYPVCNWTSDSYTNWMTQNSVNNLVQMGASAVSIVGGIGMIATGAGAVVGAGMIAGGVSAVLNQASQYYQHSMVPDQAHGNTNCGDVVFSAQQNNFKWMDMSIKAEYARIIDEFFDMFGYKVNRLKVPNVNHRSNWWYTKTIDVNIDGPVPMTDMQKIKNAYNNGITFWKNPSNIQNYSVNNSIV